MCDIVFKKENGRDGMVKRTSDFTRAAARKDSMKNMKNFVKFTIKHLCRSLFFDKVRRYCFATSLNAGLQCRCFLENFPEFV